MSAAPFLVIAILTLAGALAAASLRKLIHAAFCLVAAFVGMAAFFLLLGAEFVGLVQVFVYVGAVAVLIVFTVLLTHREDENTGGFNWPGVLIAIGVFAGLTWAIFRTPGLTVVASPMEALTVKQIGQAIMTDYVWPLQCIGVLLTAALIGGLILVMEDNEES